ncbi:MAG TPA: lysophospholipid acyltransferase family protein [Candidatus Baltobacteraceae bacterium]|nr:lysophospholipid acyltransferase family protein [Candidatus Baltobacteraceae bacterium]
MNTALYDGAKYSLWALFGTLWRMRVHGAANVPRNGPLIVACNHVSYLDPPVLGTACPRRIQYMAKQELFKIPVLGPAIAAVGAYPVDRKGSAVAAIKRSVEVLKRGGAVGIFPEGTRNRDGSGSAQSGVALLASLSGAPVLPACITGSGRANKFAKIDVYFGTPIALPADRKATRDELEAFSQSILATIRSLPQEYAR